MIKVLCTTVILLVGSSLLSAQEQSEGHGQIRGTVSDATTEESLVGVNVAIQGTSIGAATNLDGEYVIRRVPVGTHTVVVGYLGYERRTMEVEVTRNETLELDVALSPVAIEGDEVVIGAQREGQQDAINQQLTSERIVNVVSEARIQELPDFNAAQALSRLPGVSTQQSSGEANKIVVRGLSPEYNSIEVDGVRLSATGSSQMGVASQPGMGSGSVGQDRSVDLTMVSPYMIRTVQLYKALTPDMNANSLGGTVNMELREAPSETTGDFLYQQGYTNKSNHYGNYRSVISGSSRFLDDRLGVYALANIESYDRDADNMNAGYGISGAEEEIDPETGYRPVQVNNVTLNRRLETRQRYGANLVMDYRLGDEGNIKFVNMFARLNSDYVNHNQRINYRADRMEWNLEAGEQTIDQQMNSLRFDYDFGFMETNLSASYTSANNNEEDSPRMGFNQMGAIDIEERENVHPEDLTFAVNYLGDEQVKLRTANVFSNDYKEEKYSFKADFEVPYSFSGLTGYVKFGGQMDDQINTTDQHTPYMNITGGGEESIQGRTMRGIADEFNMEIDSEGDFPGNYFRNSSNNLYDPFLDDDFGSVHYASDVDMIKNMLEHIRETEEYDATRFSSGAQGGWYDGPYQQLANDYEYNEDYYATYAMSRINFGDFMAVGGVRYERVDSEYFAYNARDTRNVQRQQMYDTTATATNEHLLPMAQLRYSPTEWLDIRAAYTHTLARPNYSDLTPKFTITMNNQIYTGNTQLEPAKSKNYDLSATFHANRIGLFSVGVFHKEIENFVYNASYNLFAAEEAGMDQSSHYTVTSNGSTVIGPSQDSDYTVHRPLNNPEMATVSGIEIDFQHSFWYLPAVFSNMVAGFNYSRMTSEATYPFYDTETYFIDRERHRDLIEGSRTGRLIDQPNDLLNAYVGYDYEGFSARLSFQFEGESPTNIDGVYPERDYFSRDYYQLDFSARQKLPWLGSEVFLDVSNLNNREYESAQRTTNGFSNVQNYGMTANIGIRIRP